MTQDTHKDPQEIQTDILLREAAEEVRNDKIKEAFQKYKWPLIAVVAAIIFSAVFYEGLKSWRTQVRLADSDLYEQAAVLHAKGHTDEALAVYKGLDKASTSYRYLAQMRVAGIELERGNKDAAVAILDALRLSNDAPDEVRAVAAISYVGQLADTGDTATLMAVLAPYLKTDSPFYGSATEMAALLMIRDKKDAEAKQLLTDALAGTAVQAATRARLQTLLETIEK